MEYKVVPFVASIDPKKGTSDHVAEQLESLIKNYTNQGWEYVRRRSIHLCLSSNRMFWRKQAWLYYS